MEVTGRCRRCGKKTQPQGSGAAWHQQHVSRGLCRPCWRWAHCNDALVDYPRLTRSRDDLLDDYVILRAQGYSWHQCAQRLGMTYTTFERAMNRARAAGDARAGRIGEHWPPPQKAIAS